MSLQKNIFPPKNVLCPPERQDLSPGLGPGARGGQGGNRIFRVDRLNLVAVGMGEVEARSAALTICTTPAASVRDGRLLFSHDTLQRTPSRMSDTHAKTTDVTELLKTQNCCFFIKKRKKSIIPTLKRNRPPSLASSMRSRQAFVARFVTSQSRRLCTAPCRCFSLLRTTPAKSRSTV